MPTETIRDALDRALDAYAVLGALGEEIEDEWSYVTDLSRRVAGALRRGRRRRAATTPPPDDATPRSIAPSTRSAGSSDPHRAIDWLSTFPRSSCVAVGEPTVRFQDAAPRRAGRRLRRASRRTRRSPRAADAAGRRDAGPARARAGGDERRDDRPGGWRTMFPTLFGPARPATPAEQADPRRSSTPRSRSPTAASRSAARSAARSSRS